MNQLMTESDQKAVAARKASLPLGAECLDKADTIVPKVLLMQGSSEFVKEGKLHAGDLVHSTTKEKIGSKDKPIAFVPFYTFKQYAVYKQPPGADQPQFSHVVPVLEAPPSWSKREGWKETLPDGTLEIRMMCLIYYGLLDNGQPIQITFKSSSYKAGRTISDYSWQLAQIGKSMWSKTWQIGSSFVKNKNNQSYYVFTSAAAKEETAKEVQAKAQRLYLETKEGMVRAEATSEEVDGDVPF